MKKTISLILGMLLVVQLISLASALTLSGVSTNPNQVEPGNVVELVLELENNLDGDVVDVEISLDLSQTPFAPEKSSEMYLEEIEEDEDEEIGFNLIVDADAEAKAYKIPVSIKYTFEDEEESKSFTVSINVNAKPTLALSLDDILFKNQKNIVDVRITNTGLGEAKLLEVRLGGSGSYEILSSHIVYVGDLDSDDFDTVKFDVFLRGGGSVSFPITLKYRDSTNKEFTETKILTGRAYSIEEATGLGLIQKDNTLMWVIGGVVLVVAWIIYRKIKKRRKARRR